MDFANGLHKPGRKFKQETSQRETFGWLVNRAGREDGRVEMGNGRSKTAGSELGLAGLLRGGQAAEGEKMMSPRVLVHCCISWRA